jgi:hypothetical protein
MQLQEIQQFLQSEPFATSFEPASEEAPLDRLVVILEGERGNYLLEIAYIPNLDDQLENLELLQFFVRLPCEVKQSVKPNVKDLILRLNINSPLIGWGFYEELDLLYFRHVLVLSNLSGTHTQEIFVGTVWLIFYLLESFYPEIVKITASESNPD